MQPDQVAIYFAAAKTLALVHFVYFAVRAGGAQRFSKYYTNGDTQRLETFVRDTLHWTFWPSLALVLLIFVVGKQLLLLFGPAFGSGYPLLFILSAGLLVRASIGPAESLLTMAGQQRICAAIYTITFVINVVLNFVLIPRLGLAGAALATSIALILETIALYFATRNRLGIRSFILFTFPPFKPATGEGWMNETGSPSTACERNPERSLAPAPAAQRTGCRPVLAGSCRRGGRHRGLARPRGAQRRSQRLLPSRHPAAGDRSP